jgi:hypothetical protein
MAKVKTDAEGRFEINREEDDAGRIPSPYLFINQHVSLFSYS